jgi:hypothetical protein
MVGVFFNRKMGDARQFKRQRICASELILGLRSFHVGLESAQELGEPLDSPTGVESSSVK